MKLQTMLRTPLIFFVYLKYHNKVKILFHLSLIYCLSAVLQASTLHITLSKNHVLPGQTVKAHVLSTYPLKNKWIAYNKKRIPLFLHPKKHKRGHYWYIGHIGISRKALPKKQKIFFHLIKHNNKKMLRKFTLHIKKNQFKKQHITLNKTNQNRQRDTKQIIKENQRIAKALSKKVSVSKHFFSPFQWPTKGSISSPFGSQRIYNGRPSWSHSGLDIAAKTGTPIYSPSIAIVKLSENMLVHGNTIILDHGWGIQSIYNHLDTLSVKPGDFIKKGHKIGTVGSTGLSTGPHLHWAVAVHQVRVNPHDWIKDANLYE